MHKEEPIGLKEPTVIDDIRSFLIHRLRDFNQPEITLLSGPERKMYHSLADTLPLLRDKLNQAVAEHERDAQDLDLGKTSKDTMQSMQVRLNSIKNELLTKYRETEQLVQRYPHYELLEKLSKEYLELTKIITPWLDKILKIMQQTN